MHHAQNLRQHALGGFELWVVAHVGKLDQPRPRQPRPNAVCNVRPGDRVGHAPHKLQRNLGALDGPLPAPAKLFSIGHVVDQPVGKPVAAAASNRSPVLPDFCRGGR